ncbi:MAG TPA: adenylate kinase [Gemmatimonadaceae bacterium]|jgi:adenylate kinase|nr:adenylate kinase [Gemmatimonadaceae bacterium]HMH85964.1 adenylate kinase [Gemmatimonadaceae bacterium]
MIIVLLGPPGAGKGTQADKLAMRLGIPKIATGDVLRAAVRDGTRRGLEAKAYMDRGDLVPDSVILGILQDVMTSPATKKGAILDGAVRTVPQAEGLGVMLAEIGKQVDKVLLFDVDDDVLVKRLSTRTVCEGCQTPYTGREPGSSCEKCGGKLVRRKDDEPEAVRNRLEVYRRQTAPVIDWYADRKMKVQKIDADASVDEVTSRAIKALKK